MEPLKLDKDIKELMSVLQSASAEWFHIGVFLKVEDHDLQSIEHQYNEDPRRCLYEVLRRWLISGEPSTCKDLLDALMAIDKIQLAHSLGQKFNCPLPVDSEGMLEL